VLVLVGGDDAGGAAITGGGVVGMGAELAGGLTGAVAVAGGAVTGAVDVAVGARGDAAIGVLALSLRDAARLTRARLAGTIGYWVDLTEVCVIRIWWAGAAAGAGDAATGAGVATGVATGAGATGVAWAGAALGVLMTFRAIPTLIAVTASTAAMAMPIHFGLRCPRSSRRKIAAPAPIPPGVGAV
jgi:hypothetical protein